MRRLPLSAWLALISVGLVVLVLAVLVPAGLGLLSQLAAESARARVELAAVHAVESLEVTAEETLIGARLLAERPTLLRLAASRRNGGTEAELAAFLDRFRTTGGFDGAAVLGPDGVLTAAPQGLAWEETVARLRARLAAAEGVGYLAGDPGEEPAGPLVAALVPLAGALAGEALLLRRLDAGFTQRLTERVGLATTLVAYAPAGSEPASAAPAGALVARRRLGGAEGDLAVEVQLPASEVTAALAPLRRAFALATLVAAAGAVAAGVLAGRFLARPLSRLRRAAERIGAGDLATPVPAAPGAEAGALALTMEDMRQGLRTLNSELRRREAEAKALLSGISEGVFAVDGERRIEYLNPQAARLLGVEPDAVLGRFCGDVLHPAGRGGQRPCETACPIVHARSLGGSRAVEHLRLAAGRRTVVITSAPPAGRRQVQVIRDETEIEAARRSRDAVLANVSHELKTPLSAQLASIELLREAQERPGSQAEAAQLVASLERSTLRLTRLIDNLLESVRIETGQASARRLPVEWAAVVSEAAALLRPLLAQRSQRLEIHVPADLPPGEGDPAQLTQVVVNLLANAHKYAPAGTVIAVGAALDPENPADVLLWVDDAGPGVAPALSQSIFDRFQRAEVQGDGMGLGLWIVKSIVERHGGTVSVAPSSAGGARFTVRLPVGKEDWQ